MATITALMIDSREPAWVQALKFGGIPAMVTMLETGDVQAITDDGHTLIIERKTPEDFLNTLREDRLFPQLARMVEARNAQRTNDEPVTQWAYLVIQEPLTCNREGKVITDRGVTGWSWNAIQGTLLSIQELGIFVVYANGQSDYEDCILRIGKRNRSPEMAILAPRAAKMLGPAVDFLTGIPGIGPETVHRLLDWCGNVPAHALIGLADLDVNAPVALNVRKRFRSLLGLQDNEGLEVVLKGDITNAPIVADLKQFIGEKING
jgi:ERCC4-type nuclease